MRRDERMLVGGLFTRATEILEDTHVLASHTQRPKSAAQCCANARKLLTAAEDLQALAKAVLAVVK